MAIVSREKQVSRNSAHNAIPSKRMTSDSRLRVVSLQPSATAILKSLGKLDHVVACTKYCLDICPELLGRVIVADSWTAQSAQILNAHPDLVIASVPYQEKAVIEILKSGTRFLGLAPKTLSDIYQDIALIAGVVDAVDSGRDVIEEMKGAIRAISEKTKELSRRLVFCEEWGKPLIASQSWVAELVVAAGGQFVGEPGATTSAEVVLAQDPDVFVAAWCGAGDRVPLRKIVRDRNWTEARFVKNARVYCIADELLNTPAPTLIEGLRALAAALHPEIFPSVRGLKQIT
ncbi:MAG: ABC transporter substrate-binding protein [Acidobacteriota bacterium]|nr:ABC transporter substrate-binding protein [Acidobacteriota bacterium]